SPPPVAPPDSTGEDPLLRGLGRDGSADRRRPERRGRGGRATAVDDRAEDPLRILWNGDVRGEALPAVRALRHLPLSHPGGRAPGTAVLHGLRGARRAAARDPRSL